MREGTRANTYNSQDCCHFFAKMICIFSVVERQKPSKNLLFGRICSKIDWNNYKILGWNNYKKVITELLRILDP